MAGRRKRQEDHVTLPFDMSKGMWTSGDRGLTPRGYVSKARNMTSEPLRWDLRPQFTYDDTPSTGIRQVGNWFDQTNGVTRLVASYGSKTYAKATSGEAWGADLGSSVGGRLYDSTNYRGTWYATGESTLDGAYFGMISYDGTTFKAAGYEEMAFSPASLTPYKERMFYGGVLWHNTTPMKTNGFYSSMFYDAASSAWTKTSVTASSIVDGAKVTYRITPTSTTAGMLRTPIPDNLLTINGVADVGVRFTARLRGNDRQYAFPVSAQLRYGEPWTAATAYTLGAMVVPTTANNFVYQATVAGTSHAATEPVWPTTVGSTVVDNASVTWMCIGSDILAKTDAIIPSASDSRDPTPVTVFATLPQGALTLNASGPVDMVLTLYNDANPTVTLATLDFGYQDGKASSDITKANWGQMSQAGYVTEAECIAPFPSAEDAAGFNVPQRDYLYWSEPLTPRRVLAQNYYRLTDTPGPITGVRVIGGKLCASKRQSLTVFGATDDPDIPILPEGESKLFGWLNPKACDVYDDYGYFIGEDEVFRWRPGMERPEPLCGDAMREEIMARNVTTTTTGNGLAFTNQPANDGVEIGSDNAADTTQTATVIGTTQGTDIVVVESIALTGTSFVSTVKTDWGVILAVKLSASCAGTVTFREASGNATITTVTTGNTSKGVETVASAQQLSFNGYLKFVASGSTTKQIGVKGTNPAGTVIYDSQALTGTTAVWGNSLFMTVTEIYTGDIESNRTVTETGYSWCEDQQSPANRALLSVDRATRKVYVYTQNGRIYVYSIDREAWAVMDAGGGTGVNPYGYPVCDMIFNPTTRNMYFAFSGAPAGTAGLARLDPKVTPTADSFSSSGTSTVTAELWPRPLELFGPRMDMTVEVARIHHRVTESQSGQTTTFGVSTDQGLTFPATNQVTLDPVSTGQYRPMEVALFQTGGTLQMRVVHSGNGGAASFNVSQFEVDVQSHAQELTRDHPTPGSASL